MRKSLTTLGVMAIAVVLATSAFAVNRGVSFHPIGFIEDPGPYPASQVYNMNPQGTIFMVTPTPWGNYCVMYTMEDGWGTHVGEASGLCHIASDGTIMGDGYDYDTGVDGPGIWTGEFGVWDYVDAPVGSEPCGSSQNGFFGMADDGSYATGLNWYGCSSTSAWTYNAATDTSVALPIMETVPGEGGARGNDVNSHGDVVGWNTMLFGNWRGAEWVDGVGSFIDGQGTIEPMICVDSGNYCTHNGSDPIRGCPEYVDDASCNNGGFCDLAGIECLAGVCTGGVNAGLSCSGYWNCPGSCTQGSNVGANCTSDSSCPGTCEGGENPGDSCTSDYSCPDTIVCVDNPAWTPEAYKGEALANNDAGYAMGENFGESSYDYGDPNYDPTLWASGYVRNPDGSFTQVGVPEGASPYDSWTMLEMSDAGDVVVGRYGWWIYSFPTMWIRGAGSFDFQWFLVSQGLDELWFWYLSSLNDVSADGNIVAGTGSNPDNWSEGFIVDMTKISVCHAPGGDMSKARTLTIDRHSIADHVGHGDFVGTCEFAASGANSRSVSDLRPSRPGDVTSPDSNSVIRTEEEARAAGMLVGNTPATEQTGRTGARTGVRAVKSR